MSRRAQTLRLAILAFLVLSLVLPLFPIQVAAARPDDQARIQIVQGEIPYRGHGQFYHARNLHASDILYVYVHTETGNLDPLAAVVDAATDVMQINLDFNQAVNEAFQAGKDPIAIVPDFADTHFLAWDDDSGWGYDAVFQYTIPKDGDYQILVYPSPSHMNWGKFTLMVGVNAPQVLKGQVQEDVGEPFVDKATIFPPIQAAQVVTGTLQAGKKEQLPIVPLKAGDTFYAYAETESEHSSPVLELRDFGDKLLAAGIPPHEGGQQISLSYTVQEDAKDYVLVLSETTPEATGPYRIVAGINNSDVLTGQAQPTPNNPVFQQPIPVQIGLKIDQITNVDQKAENFSVVNTLQMEWQDPKLAFNPATCDCKYQSMSISSFQKYADDHGTIWPEFVFFNQQGRRDIQNGLVVVFSDGRAIYYERSSVTLQAPDFDFRLYPFDIQTFFVRIRMVFPDHLFTYTEMPGFTGMGDQLGEEEWVVQEQWTEIQSVDRSSQFSFGFKADRHLMYYVVRIFVPVLLIIIVSWFTFFLKDYSKRVDVASANLLIFVAFNFTISDALPHLGYATVLDLVLVTTFVITGLVVIFNVWLKRLEISKKESIAHVIDKYSIWLYPIMYFAAFAAVAFFFARANIQ